MSQGGGNNSSQDPALGAALVMVVLGLVGWLIYKSNKEGIHYAIINLRNIEIWLIAKFFWIVGLLDSSSAEFSRVMEANRQAMMAIPIARYEWENIVQISLTVGPYIRWVAVPVIAYMTWFLIFKHPKSVLRRVMGLPTLINYQCRRWAAIAPIVKNDPLSDKDGKWLEALDPMEWAQRHGIDIEDGAPDREAARAALSRQLRHPWTRASDLPLYLQALVAAFTLRGNKKGDECYDILNRLARGSAAHGTATKAIQKDKTLEKLILKTLRDSKMMTETNRVARQHAWVETAMAALLDWARGHGGVLASSDFLWLKMEDRAIWYVLNAVGRPTSLIEAAGAMSHWKAEIVTRRPMPEPDVDEAVFGLEEYLASHHA